MRRSLAVVVSEIFIIAAYLAAIWLAVGATHSLSAALMQWSARSPLRASAKCLVSAVAASLTLLVVLIVTAVFLLADGKGAASIGISDFDTAFTQFYAGAFIAFFGSLLLFVVGWRASWFSVVRSNLLSGDGSSLPGFCGGATYAVTASILEEVILRGYTFTMLYQAYGGLAAVVGSATVFAVLHVLVQPRIPALYVLNTFLFGLISAYARLATGCLWVPIGLHIGWNLPMTSLYGFPIHGAANKRGLFACAARGPKYLTGGEYCPDGGLLGVLALAGIAAALIYAAPSYFG